MMNQQRLEDWADMEEAWLDDPQSAANHLCFGMNLETRKKARMITGKKSVHTWI
jgi:hypothetical protein